MSRRVFWMSAIGGLALLASTSVLIRGWLATDRGSLIARPIFMASANEIRVAINGLRLTRAEELLNTYPSMRTDAAALRARLALYRGDCDEARAVVGAISKLQPESGQEISLLADGCARAMAAARLINDEKRSVWVRLQDDADASWAPLIIDTAVQARSFVAGKLGISSDLPLRIELVMDHASLSALTGLPLEAAETTGTVAVARFGRVTLLSPRAFQKGYPWQDTLAHEITHLMVTAATNDNAPLWLQEALAKHLEAGWRPPRPHDGLPNQHEVARSAWLSGRAVGFEHLGASIALLPNPEAANVAYAEVFDFLAVIVRECGWNAIQLLLHELRGLGDEGTDAALRSVTGYSLKDWTRRWRHQLSTEPPFSSPQVARRHDSGGDLNLGIEQRLRISELFALAHRYDALEATLPSAVLGESPITEIHTLAGLALLRQGQAPLALAALGNTLQLTSVQGDWLSLRGRALAEVGQTMQATDHFTWALAYAPTDERVACEGFLPSTGDFRGPRDFPISQRGNGLCFAASSFANSAREPLPP
jgi:hypothetical protein